MSDKLAEERIALLEQRLRDACDQASRWQSAYNGVRIELLDARARIAELEGENEQLQERAARDVRAEFNVARKEGANG